MIKDEQKALGQMLENNRTSFYGQMLELEDDEEEEKKEESEAVQIQHKQNLLMFMISKDDNLLLQMGSLFNSIILSNALSDELK